MKYIFYQFPLNATEQEQCKILQSNEAIIKNTVVFKSQYKMLRNYETRPLQSESAYYKTPQNEDNTS